MFCGNSCLEFRFRGRRSSHREKKRVYNRVEMRFSRKTEFIPVSTECFMSTLFSRRGVERFRIFDYYWLMLRQHVGAVGLMMCFGWVLGVGLLWFWSVIETMVNLRWFAFAIMVSVGVLPLITYIVTDVITVTMFYRAILYVVGIKDAVVTHPTWANRRFFYMGQDVRNHVLRSTPACVRVEGRKYVCVLFLLI